MAYHTHKLIAETAQAMAHELYDTMMQDNVWYKAWKSANVGASVKALETRFVNRNWPRLVPEARATLAKMLAGPYDGALKQQIYQALILDNSLRRQKPKDLVPAVKLLN